MSSYTVFFYRVPYTECNTSQCGGLSWNPRESQEEGQEDQGRRKELGGAPCAAVKFPGRPNLPSGSSLGSLTIHNTGWCCTLPYKSSKLLKN